MRYVIDTHALNWYLTASLRLSASVKDILDRAVAGTGTIVIRSIVLAELFYLNEKHGRPFDYVEQHGLLSESAQYELLPLEPQDITDFDIDSGVREIHDRMIVGVARRLGAPLLTRDAQIVSGSDVETVW